mgnify:CR=1 FL=1
MFKQLSFILLLLVFGNASALTLTFPDGDVDTLEELDSWLHENYTTGDVVVKIAPGTYQDSALWSFDAGGNRLQIQAQDASNPPIFDGCVNSACIAGQMSGFFMRIEGKKKRLNNIILRDIVVQNFVNGIYLNNVDNSTIRKVEMRNIGTAFNAMIPVKSDGSRAYDGYAAIMTNNSENITIEYSDIHDAYNDERPSLMHATYLKDTRNSSIHKNNINKISGDPIRFRHRTHDISITYNTISNSGRFALSTWHKVRDNADECPSYNITSKSNTFGLMFPFAKTYGVDGFGNKWGAKKYLAEGLVQRQGYQVTASPLLSPESCLHRYVASKWQTFTSINNSYVFPAASPLIVNVSKDLEVKTNSIQGQYVRMARDAEMVLETNMFFIGCNTSTTDTCDDKKTSKISDDIDPLNHENSSQRYYFKMMVKSGTAVKKLMLNGGGYTNKELHVPVNENNDWFEFRVPAHIGVKGRDDAVLNIRSLNNGLMIKSIRLTEIEQGFSLLNIPDTTPEELIKDGDFENAPSIINHDHRTAGTVTNVNPITGSYSHELALQTYGRARVDYVYPWGSDVHAKALQGYSQIRLPEAGIEHGTLNFCVVAYYSGGAERKDIECKPVVGQPGEIVKVAPMLDINPLDNISRIYAWYQYIGSESMVNVTVDDLNLVLHRTNAE